MPYNLLVVKSWYWECRVKRSGLDLTGWYVCPAGGAICGVAFTAVVLQPSWDYYLKPLTASAWLRDCVFPRLMSPRCPVLNLTTNTYLNPHKKEKVALVRTGGL